MVHFLYIFKNGNNDKYVIEDLKHNCLLIPLFHCLGSLEWPSQYSCNILHPPSSLSVPYSERQCSETKLASAITKQHECRNLRLRISILSELFILDGIEYRLFKKDIIKSEAVEIKGSLIINEFVPDLFVFAKEFMSKLNIGSQKHLKFSSYQCTCMLGILYFDSHVH